MTAHLHTTLTDKVHLLLADDREENLDALSQTLGTEYLMTMARSGYEVIEKATQDFACILLDVRMPHMDGFEVAKYLRNNTHTKSVPIIFVTAEATRQNEIFEGYSAGAVDYLVKPLIPQVVRAKVKVFADLFRQRKALDQSALVEKLYNELKYSNDEYKRLTWIASHDLREPVRKIHALVDLLKDNEPESNHPLNTKIMISLTESTEEMLKMVDSFRNLTALYNANVSCEKIQLNEMIQPIIASYAQEIHRRNISIVMDTEHSLWGDRKMFATLIEDLIENAFVHTQEKEFQLKLTTQKDKNYIFFDIENTAPGNESVTRKVTGVGLTTARQIIRMHGGEISVQSQPGVFKVRMQLEDKNA